MKFVQRRSADKKNRMTTKQKQLVQIHVAQMSDEETVKKKVLFIY